MKMESTQQPGFHRVDDHPEVSTLLAAMEATARWDATLRLRAWEREHLALTSGQRLLDVGCGLGDAAVSLAGNLGVHGEIVGIDASDAMIAAARARADSALCHVRFAVGNAQSLDEPDDAFDAVRSERTLQWLTDPGAAMLEIARVLRPRGSLSLIDTDWSTLTLDVGDNELTLKVRDAMQAERRRPTTIGRRLAGLVRDVGLEVVGETTATHRWDVWDPDVSPAPDGCFPMARLAQDLVDADQLSAGDQEQFVSTVHAAAREGRFRMSLRMFAVAARAPAAAV